MPQVLLHPPSLLSIKEIKNPPIVIKPAKLWAI
jgi:hypothetical protein